MFSATARKVLIQVAALVLLPIAALRLLWQLPGRPDTFSMTEWAGTVWVVVFLVAGLLVLLMVWRAQRLAVPVIAATKLAERIEAGEEGLRLDLRRSNPDFARFESAFNRMLDRVETTVRKLEQSELRYQKVLQATNDAIWDWDLSSDRFEWNEGYELLFGHRREAAEVDARSWFNYIHPDDIERVRKRLYRAIEEGDTQWRDEYRFLRSDGSAAFVMDRGFIIREADGNPFRMIGGITDVTERERNKEELEERVRHRTAELEVINKELESFCYSVSHDLRAPLRSIAGFAEALEDDFGKDLDDEANRYLGRIKAGAARMGNLIDDLLNLSRVSRSELKRNAVVPEQVFRRVAAERAEAVGALNVEWTFSDCGEIQFDPGLLELVFSNLVDNALKFSGKREVRRIGLTFQTTGDGGVAIGVIDNGVGFAKEYAAKLYAPFQRLHRQDEFPGTGVGLATVQRIVAKHGGSVFASGNLDEGAHFGFNLPRQCILRLPDPDSQNDLQIHPSG